MKYAWCADCAKFEFRQAYAVERTRGTWGDVATLLGSVVAAAFGLTIVTGLLFALLVTA